MKARDRLRSDTLRSALSAFSYRKIDAGAELSDDQQVEVVRKLVKQRNDSIAEFTKANRPELVEKETAERDILLAFLPARRGAEDIRPEVRAALEAMPPAERTMSQAMKALMPRFIENTDGSVVRQVVTDELRALGSA